MQQDDDEIILPQVTPDTGIDAETQMTPEEAVDVYEVGTDTVRTPTGLGPRRTDYVQPTDPFAPTGQTVPLSFTGSGVSMYSPIQFTKQTPYEAITGEAEYKLQPFPFTGAAFYGYRKPAVDPTIAREQALVTVEEAYTKANFPDKARNTLIMAQTGFLYNKQGDPAGKLTYAPFTEEANTPEKRLLVMNNSRAQTLVKELTGANNQKLRSETPIPYTAITESLMGDLEEVDSWTKINLPTLPFSELEEGSVAEVPFVPLSKSFDKETADGKQAFFAAKFVKWARSQNFEERDIAGVLKHRVGLPVVPGTAIGYGDLSLVRNSLTDIARFGGESALYLMGEGYEAMTLWNSQLQSDLFTGGVNISDPYGREEILKRWFPQSASVVQDHYANGNLDVDFIHAEQMSRWFNSPATSIVGVAMGVKSGGAAFRYMKTLSGKKEVERFKRFAAEQQELFPGSTEDEIVSLYKQMRAKEALGVSFDTSTFHDAMLKVPFGRLVSKPTSMITTQISKINGIRTSNALYAGMQIEDAALRVHARSEVRRFVAYGVNLKNERKAIISSAKERDKPLTAAENNRVAVLDKEITAYKNELRLIMAESQVPAFMRGEAGKAISRISTSKFIGKDIIVHSGGIDTGVILAGSLGSQMSTYYGGDPLLWEFLSSAGMLATNFSVAGLGTAASYVSKLGTTGALSYVDVFKAGNLRGAERLLKNAARFDQEFQAGMNERILYFNQMRSDLVKAGVNPDYLDRSAAQMLGLMQLQIIEESARVAIDAPNTAQFKDKGAMLLEKTRGAQELLINQLRGIFKELETLPESQDSTTAVGRLYDTINAALEFGDQKIAQIDADLRVLDRDYEDFIYSLIQNTSSAGAARVFGMRHDDLVTTMEEYSRVNVPFMTISQARRHNKSAKEQAEKGQDGIARAARNIASIALPSNAAAQSHVGLLSNKFGMTHPEGAADLPSFDTGPKLLSLSLEMLRNEADSATMRPFQILGGQDLKMRVGDELRPVGVASTDGGDILDQIIVELGRDENIELINAMNSRNVGSAKVNKILGTLNDVSEGIIEQQATKRGLTPEEYIKAMEDKAASVGFKLDKNLPTPLAIVSFMRQLKKGEGKTLNVFPLSPQQIISLDNSLGVLISQAQNANRAPAAASYVRLRIAAADAMENFQVLDTDTGRMIPAGDLIAEMQFRNTPEGETVMVSFRDALRQANAERKNFFHALYNDPTLISGWLGTKTNVGNPRVSIPATSDNPMGMGYGNNKPSQWIRVDKWAALDVTEQKDRLTTLAGIWGVEKTIDGKITRVIDVDTAKGRAFQKILGAIYREHLMTLMDNPPANMTFGQIQEQIRRFEQAFTGVNKKGEKVLLVDTDSQFEELFGPINEITVGSAKANDAAIIMRGHATRNADEVKRQVKAIKEGISKSLEYLKRFTPEDMDADRVATELIRGGPQRIAALKKHLRTTSDLDDKDINMVLRHVMTNAITQRTFSATGQYRVVPGQAKYVDSGEHGPWGSRLVQRYDFNVQELGDFLGVTGPEAEMTKLAIREMVGDENYKIYMTVYRFMADQQERVNQQVRITGVPRQFSVESYISRIYALQRKVVSFRYVGTEAILQQYRNNNMSLLTEMISNPEVAKLLMKVVATGKPLPYEQDRRLAELLVIGLERYSTTGKPELTLRAETGQSITFDGPQSVTKTQEPKPTTPGFSLTPAGLALQALQSEGARKLFGEPVTRQQKRGVQ